jgi:enoyl-CoA hydratase
VYSVLSVIKKRMSAFETVIYEKKDDIAYITLNRPKNLNVYNIRMRDDLYEIIRAVKDDDEIKAGIFKGNGEKAFCAGADLSEFLSAPPPVSARQARFERDIWGLLNSVPQPLIAALHGYVLGSGIEIALCCDIRIASEDAQFGMPEAGLGIIPAAGGTQTLPRLIGRSRALEIFLYNRRIDAKEAHRIGLINRIIPIEKLYRSADEIAERIASFDPAAVRYAKRAITKGLDLTLAQGLDMEKRFALHLARNKENQSRSSGE